MRHRPRKLSPLTNLAIGLFGSDVVIVLRLVTSRVSDHGKAIGFGVVAVLVVADFVFLAVMRGRLTGTNGEENGQATDVGPGDGSGQRHQALAGASLGVSDYSETGSEEGSLPTPALDDLPTRNALRVYRLRSLRATGIGVAALVIAVVAVQPNNGNPSQPLSTIGTAGFAIALLGLVAGTTGLVRSLRMKHLLGRSSWVVRRANYRIAPVGANGQPALLIRADGHGPEAVCSVPTTKWRYRQLPQGSDTKLLVIGDPRRWAVVAPPDRSVLLVAKRPLVPWWSHKLRKYATAS